MKKDEIKPRYGYLGLAHTFSDSSKEKEQFRLFKNQGYDDTYFWNLDAVISLQLGIYLIEVYLRGINPTNEFYTLFPNSTDETWKTMLKEHGINFLTYAILEASDDTLEKIPSHIKKACGDVITKEYVTTNYTDNPYSYPVEVKEKASKAFVFLSIVFSMLWD